MNIKPSVLAALALPALAAAFPPGAPMSELGHSQVSLGLFLDHSGQDLFEETAPSVLNTAGLAAEYAPWPYLSFGVFAGGAELDTDVPDSRANDAAAVGFDTDWSFTGGASLKVATPRFADGTTRLVGYGAGTWFSAKDEHENEKRGGLAEAGASLQYLGWGKVNFVVGGEFRAILQGEQTSSRRSDPEPFGLSAPAGLMDYLRGLVGVEYYFKGRNQPYVSIAFRPTGAIGWHDNLGLRNASVSISLGAIATLPGKGKNKVQDEEDPLLME